MSKRFKRLAVSVSLLTFGILILLTVNAKAEDKAKRDNKLPEALHLLAFSHFDLAWTGTTPECLSRSYRIFSEAISKAQADPAYRYFIDNMFYFYRYIESHPEQLSTLKDLVKNGQLELNPLWIVNFQDDNDGELSVRNFLYSKKFIRNTFGIEPQAVSMTDIPDWTPQFPQILAKSGIRFLVMTRNGPKNNHLFWWKSADKSKLLTYHIGYGGLMYEPIIELSRKPYLVKNHIEKSLAVFSDVCKAKQALGFCGSDRTLPIPDLEEDVAIWNGISSVKMKISTLREYYESVKDTPGLPVLSGQVPNMWIVEATFAKTFQDDQKALNLLATAEKLAAISNILGYTRYPAEKIEEAWKGLILAHDHGYGGHGYEEGDRRKIVERQKAIYTAEEIIEDSFTPIAEHVKTDDKDCIPIVVFNPMSWERNETVSAHFTLQIGQSQAGYNDTGLPYKGQRIETYPIKIKDKIVLKDDQGRLLPFQIIKKYQVLEYYILFRAEKIPALGYKTYYIYPALEEYKAASPLTIGKNSLENEFLKLALDENKGTFSLYDKKSGKEIVNNVRFSLIENLDSIRAGKQPEDLKEIPVSLKQVIIEEKGPLRAALRLVYTSHHPCFSRLEIKLSLSSGENKLDIEPVVDYKMQKRREILGLSLVFPFDIKNPAIQYGVPYGYNDSANLLPDSGIARRQPDGPGIPAHLWKRCRLVQKWLDVKGKDAGFTVAASRQFFIISDKDLRCELLHLNAGGFYDCREIRAGTVTSSFSIIPHANTWQEDKTYRAGWELNNPLLVYSVNDTVSKKTLPKTLSFLGPLSDNTIVTVLKKEENGEGLILRLFESEGRNAGYKLKFFKAVSGVWDSSLIEDTGNQLDSSADGDTKANEIKTLKIYLEKP